MVREARGIVRDRPESVLSRRIVLVAVALLLGLQAVALAAMGHPWICTCGRIRLWWGEVYSPENSQHLFDWYTPSHLIHGMLFVVATTPLRRWGTPVRLLAAVVVEVTWELIENSPPVIERYRSVTMALDYYGDSVVNSLADTVAMMVGFALARSLPVVATLALAVALELVTAWWVRDNLTLNVLMLLWPVDAVRHWQLELAPPSLRGHLDMFSPSPLHLGAIGSRFG